MSEHRINPKQLVILCYVIASYLFLSIVMAMLRVHTFIAVPGAFLFDRFHLASLYIPALFTISGLLIKSGRLPKRTMLMLWISPVLFLSAAVMFQLLSGNTSVLSARVLIAAFGRFPATALFVLLLAMEITGMVKLASFYTDPEDRLFPPGEIRRRLEELLAFVGMNRVEVEEVPAGGEEPTLEDRPPMSYPSFPDVPEPMEPLDSREEGEKEGETDPEVSDLIRKVLTGSSGGTGNRTDAETSVIADPVPAAAAVPDSEEVLESPGKFQAENDPAFAFLAGPDAFDEPAEVGMGELFSAPDYTGDTEDESLPEAVLTRESEALETEEPESAEEIEDSIQVPGESPDTSLLPEEDRDITDISEKLDPQGSEPLGILHEVKSNPRPKRRKKYDVPVDGILADYPESDFSSIDENTRKAAGVLEQTLKEFRIEAKVTGIRKGPVITMFELLPSPGVKISSIVNLQDNIALRLAASRVRIIAPIPGKHAVGIEVPNKKRAIVSFSSLVVSEEFEEHEAGIPVILGKDISGGNQVIDLTRTPHLLIAGATGSGKSVCVNSLISSILYSRTPQEVKMIMVDPKIVELKLYNDIPHLLTPVITNPKRALQALQWCLAEMERRYSLLDTQGVRDIKTFNKRVKDRKLATEPLPYIVVLVDEFADLMATSGKELEAIVARLAAMSRAVGIHLVLATQRPSVDVITGLIKANFPSRIAFMVAGKTDSRIIIDSMGAEKLLGRGDMLFTSAWDPFPSRMQGAFLAEEEVERLADYVKTLGEPDYIDEEMFIDEEDEEEFQLQSASGDDPMYEKALEIVVSSRKASASYLQRRLKIGYNRAARLVEDMERRGIVGPANGSKPRDLIHIPERFLSGGPEDREPSSA